MKKVITAFFASALMVLSVVPAFAASVNSPLATTAPEPTTPETTSHVKKTTDPYSPKTGTGDAGVYAILAVSALACGGAAVALAKTSKNSK